MDLLTSFLIRLPDIFAPDIFTPDILHPDLLKPDKLGDEATGMLLQESGSLEKLYKLLSAGFPEGSSAVPHYPNVSLDTGSTLEPLIPHRLIADLLLAWFRADFDSSLKICRRLFPWENGSQNNIAIFVSQFVFGTLYTSMAQYPQAHQAFAEAKKQLQNKDAYNQTILSYKIAWLHILEDEFAQAKLLLGQQQNYSTPGLDAHAHVLNGIIAHTEGAEAEAESSWLTAGQYYKSKGDHAALSSIQLYQSIHYLEAGLEGLFSNYAAQALTWMEKNNRIYLPYWWHPTFFEYALRGAIKLDCCSTQAAQILNHSFSSHDCSIHVRSANPRHTPSSHFTQNATEKEAASAHFVRRLENESFRKNQTGEHRQPHVLALSSKRQIQVQNARQVLDALLESNLFDENGVRALAKKIPHSQRENVIQPVIIAIFGLHVQGIPSKEISKRLFVAHSTVKSYLTKIYKAFELELADFSSPKARRMVLVEKAWEEGYIIQRAMV